MFLKTSGLNHKWFMLHCLVFKEQLCLSKLAFIWKALLQATHLLYRISFKLSRTFLFFFLSESSAPARRFQSRSDTLAWAGVSRRLVLYYRTRKHLSTVILNFFKKSCMRPRIRKKHRFRDAHLHMAGVAGLEPTHAGFRDPCLTNLAIPLCLQPVAVNRNHYSVSLASWQVFFSVFLKTWYKKRRYPFTGVWLCYNIVDIDLWRSWRLWRCLMDIVYI